MRGAVRKRKRMAGYVAKVLNAFGKHKAGLSARSAQAGFSIGDILYTDRFDCAFCRGTGLNRKYAKCPVCGGSGHIQIHPPALTCAYCRGDGRGVGALTCPVCRGKGVVSVKEPFKGCPRCGGTGRNQTDRLYCATCEGKGVVSARKPE